MCNLIVCLCMLRLHQCHVGGTLASHLLQQACLTQQQLGFLQFLLSHSYHTFFIRHIDVCLQHIQRSLVLLLPQCLMPHQHTRLGSLQCMQTVETIKHRQRNLYGIAIIEGANIGIAVGLRVYRPSEVVLRTDVGIHGRQEATGSTGLGNLVIVEFQFSLPHLMVVLHGILHALHGSPTRLSLCLCSIKR